MKTTLCVCQRVWLEPGQMRCPDCQAKYDAEIEAAWYEWEADQDADGLEAQIAAYDHAYRHHVEIEPFGRRLDTKVWWSKFWRRDS